MRCVSLHELRMTVLGGVGATFRARPLELGGRRQRAVLALLIAARGSAVTRDRLVEGVWGGRPPQRAAASLQAHVSHLRRCLEPERGARARGGVIVSEQAGYALRLPDDAVDAWRFEEALRSAAVHTDEGRPSEAVSVLESGLALWRGPAYAEYADEPWARQESARLAELRELQDDITANRRDALIGHTVWGLVDAPGVGRTHREAPEIDGIVHVPDALVPGTFATLTVEAAEGPDVVAA